MRRPPFAPGTFTWALGIEDTCVYPPDGAPPLDEHVLTDHHLCWRDDLRQAAELGASAVRYGMSWPLVHIAPQEFDWSHLDEVIPFAADELGLDLIADLVHYGTPTWLPQSFADPAFPGALTDFAGALAGRYAGRIRAYTPVNEPLTTASFSGLRGVWPPHRTGWDGWVSVVLPIALAASQAIAAIREADPDAVVVHVEAATLVRAGDPEHASEAELLERVGWLPTDLLLGRVGATHPMHAWLLRHGASAEALHQLETAPGAPDVLGVNYYPNLTPRRLRRFGDRVVQVAYDGGADGLAAALRGFSLRYGLPLAITETSIEGDDTTRTEWLRAAIATVHDLGYDVDLRGFTWWPLFDFVDWSYASGGANVEEFAVETLDDRGQVSIGFAPPLGHPDDGRTPFLRRMGLLRLHEESDGALVRVRTTTADAFADVSSAPVPVLGAAATR